MVKKWVRKIGNNGTGKTPGGNISMAVRNTMPKSGFLNPAQRKLPVKTITGGEVWLATDGKKYVRSVEGNPMKVVASPKNARSAQGRAFQQKNVSLKAKKRQSAAATRRVKKS